MIKSKIDKETMDSLFKAMLINLQRTEMTTTLLQKQRMFDFINASVEQVEDYGIRLNLEKSQDFNIVVWYSTWMWNSRSGNVPIPEGLQSTMRNRRAKQIMRGESQ